MTKSNKGSRGGRPTNKRLLTSMAERMDVSKQRAWQMVRQVMGLCPKCGNPAAEDGVLCDFHMEYDRKRKTVVQ